LRTGKEHRANTAAVCKANSNPDALAALQATMTAKQLVAASSSAAGLKKT
jgi:hypothetical protein